MDKEITIEVLAEKIDNLKEYLIERNSKQDILIEQNRVAVNKNTVAIAGMKGMVVGVTALITLAINAVVAFFTFKGGNI